MDLDLLVPTPQRSSVRGDRFELGKPARIAVVGPATGANRAVRQLVRDLQGVGVECNVAPSGDDPAAADIRLRLEPPTGSESVDAYSLRVDRRGVEIRAATGIGLFYGAATLAQCIRLQSAATSDFPGWLPGLDVEDWPSFTRRGVMLDISRNRVPTMETLCNLVERLASWKINQLQLYTEHTFAYTEHPEVWRGSSPLTATEVRKLDAWCHEHFVELVPNQQSFGHMHRWLRHDRYRPLAERPDGIDHPFSTRREPFSLCPTDARSLELLAGLYDELLPNFTSKLFNVGLDETIDLGTGRSATLCEQRGKQAVYLEFLNQVHRLAGERGHRIQFWADIVLRQPDSIDRIPADAIALNWGHEADHPFAEETSALAESGLEFYVCPGTSSWSSLAGRTDNALRNLANAARAGVEHGASGLLITDWGDHGHLQPLSASYVGLLAGAALAWKADTDVHPSKPLWQARLDAHVFRRPDSGLGRQAMALGNAYLATGAPCRNGTPLFHLLASPHDDLTHGRYEGMTIQRLEVVLAAVGYAIRDLDALASDDPSDVDVRELQWIARALALAGRVGIERFAAGAQESLEVLPVATRREILAELETLTDSLPALWLARSRPGGLADSLERFTPLRDLLSV